jgi:hypothetical protein
MLLRRPDGHDQTGISLEVFPHFAWGEQLEVE